MRNLVFCGLLAASLITGASAQVRTEEKSKDEPKEARKSNIKMKATLKAKIKGVKLVKKWKRHRNIVTLWLQPVEGATFPEGMALKWRGRYGKRWVRGSARIKITTIMKSLPPQAVVDLSLPAYRKPVKVSGFVSARGHRSNPVRFALEGHGKSSSGGTGEGTGGGTGTLPRLTIKLKNISFFKAGGKPYRGVTVYIKNSTTKMRTKPKAFKWIMTFWKTVKVTRWGKPKTEVITGKLDNVSVSFVKGQFTANTTMPMERTKQLGTVFIDLHCYEGKAHTASNGLWIDLYHGNQVKGPAKN